jgi:hypothetical protein
MRKKAGLRITFKIYWRGHWYWKPIYCFKNYMIFFHWLNFMSWLDWEYSEKPNKP